MNRFSLLVMGFLLVLTVSSCSEVDKLTQFSIKYNSSVTISSTTVIALPLSLATPEVQTNSESEFESHNTRGDHVEEITLSKCKLQITSPSGGTFGFLKSVEIYIRAEGLPETRIAYKDDVPDDIINVLELETTNENLKEFLKKETYSLGVRTVTDETIHSDHEIDIESVFRVDAKILGI